MNHRVSHVRIVGARGIHMVSVEDFFLLPRELRALMVVEGNVEFLDVDGDTISLEEALAQLRPSFVPLAA